MSKNVKFLRDLYASTIFAKECQKNWSIFVHTCLKMLSCHVEICREMWSFVEVADGRGGDLAGAEPCNLLVQVQRLTIAGAGAGFCTLKVQV